MQLELKKINKSFGENHVLKDISFIAKKGQAFGLLGRNGSGKSTIIRIIMDIFRADSGEVVFAEERKKLKIGYLPEERGLYPKKNILEQMVYFGELRGLKKNEAKQRAEFLLEKMDAKEYLKRELETLSKGNQQKVQLAITLMNDPDIIILDEPFSGLDPVNSSILKSLVREEVGKNKIVLFSSHQMANVEEFCDYICIINEGGIVLNGNLSDIKKEYPRNRILINPSDEDLNIGDIFESDEIKNLITDFSKVKNGFVISLKDEKMKDDFLNRLLNKKISLDTFSVLEPTLEEIFIEKAGDLVE